MEPVQSKWMALLAAMFISMIAGSVYSFGIYSPSLKSRTDGVGYTQVQVQWIAFASNLGNYIPLAGLFFDRRGAPATLVGGITFIFSGYFILWLIANNCHYGTCYLGLDSAFGLGFIACFLWGFGAGWLDVAVISTSVHNFSEHRGTVISLVKSMYGLGSGIMTQIYFGFISPNQISFILFLAFFCAAMPVLFGWLIKPVRTPASGSEAGILRTGLYAVVVVALYVLVVSVIRADKGSFSDTANIVIALVLCAYLAFLWLLVPYALKKSGPTHSDLPLMSTSTLAAAPEAPAALQTVIQRGPVAALQTLDFWLMCIAVFAGTGAGLTVNNNLSQIVKSEQGSLNAQDVVVSLFSVANSLSRVLFGACSDWFTIPRPAYLVMAVAGMGLTVFGLAFANLAGMYFLIPLCGFWYGAFWVVMPALTSDLFGVERFGANYGLVQTAVSLGALLLSVLLTSYWYDDHDDAGTNSCTGHKCFRTPLLVITGCCAVGSVAATILLKRFPHQHGSFEILQDQGQAQDLEQD